MYKRQAYTLLTTVVIYVSRPEPTKESYHEANGTLVSRNTFQRQYNDPKHDMQAHDTCIIKIWYMTTERREIYQSDTYCLLKTTEHKTHNKLSQYTSQVNKTLKQIIIKQSNKERMQYQG